VLWLNSVEPPVQYRVAADDAGLAVPDDSSMISRAF
jgi:hypothetical protein